MITLQNIAKASKNYSVFQNERRKIINYLIFCVRNGQLLGTPCNVATF